MLVEVNISVLTDNQEKLTNYTAVACVSRYGRTNSVAYRTSPNVFSSMLRLSQLNTSLYHSQVWEIVLVRCRKLCCAAQGAVGRYLTRAPWYYFIPWEPSFALTSYVTWTTNTPLYLKNSYQKQQRRSAWWSGSGRTTIVLYCRLQRGVVTGARILDYFMVLRLELAAACKYNK